MTLIELIPLFIAVSVATIIMKYLEIRAKFPGWLAVIIGIASGVVAWVLYALWLKKIEVKADAYAKGQLNLQEFDPSEGCPRGKNVYLKCLFCSKSIPTMPKKSISCTCGNIVICSAGTPTFQNHSKVRFFIVELVS